MILPKNYGGNFEKSSVGTGPFTLSAYTSKQSATFKKNPTYWQKGLPYLDGAIFTYADEQAQTLQLQAGNQDMQLSTPFQGSQALFADPNIKIVSTPSTQMREVQMRVDKAPFDNKSVRQAIAYCLDRPGIMQGLFNGKGLLGNDNVFCSLYPIGVSIPQRAQDYAKAKQLLSAAGHERAQGHAGGRGVPRGPAVRADHPAAVQAGRDHREHPAAEPGAVLRQGPERAVAHGPFGITDWAARAIPSQFFLPMLTSKGVWNSSHWSNSQFDSLAKQYDATLDEAKRKDIGTQMATIQTEETPIIIAYWIEVLRATTTKVGGVEANGAEFLDLTHAFLS